MPTSTNRAARKTVIAAAIRAGNSDRAIALSHRVGRRHVATIRAGLKTVKTDPAAYVGGGISGARLAALAMAWETLAADKLEAASDLGVPMTKSIAVQIGVAVDNAALLRTALEEISSRDLPLIVRLADQFPAGVIAARVGTAREAEIDRLRIARAKTSEALMSAAEMAVKALAAPYLTEHQATDATIAAGILTAKACKLRKNADESPARVLDALAKVVDLMATGITDDELEAMAEKEAPGS